jgi:hypothetical protein
VHRPLVEQRQDRGTDGAASGALTSVAVRSATATSAVADGAPARVVEVVVGVVLGVVVVIAHCCSFFVRPSR